MCFNTVYQNVSVYLWNDCTIYKQTFQLITCNWGYGYTGHPYIIIMESIIIILLGLEASSVTSSSLEFTFTPSSVPVQAVQMTPSPVIDACGSNPCDQICTVIDGGFECSCMEGFVLESDGTSCEG